MERRRRKPGDGSVLRDLLWISLAVLAVGGVGWATGLLDRLFDLIERSREARGEAAAAVAILTILLIVPLLVWRSSRREARARRDAENRYRALVEEVPAVIYTWDPRRGAGTAPSTYVSPQVERVMGFTEEEWTTDPDLWIRQIHPEDRARVLRASAHADSSGEPLMVEYRHVRKDGSVIWVREEAFVIDRDGHDRPSLVQGIMFDVTERKDAERAVAEAEARYRTLVERVPAVTYVWDTAKHLGETAATYISPQIEALLGYAPEEFQRDPTLWSTLVHPDDRDRVRREWDTAAKGDGTFRSEYRIRTRDEDLVWVRDEAVPISRDDAGRMVLQGVMFDITERKEAEARLVEAESSYRTLVEQLPVVVYRESIDDLGRALYLSPQYERLFGFPPDVRLRDPGFWVEHLHPDDRQRILELSRWTNESGEPFSAEYRFVANGDRVVWVRDEAQLIRDAEGRPLMWQGVLMDVTARKHAEEALSRRDAVLVAIGFAAERFLKSHDWEGALPEVLERLGTAAGAGRVYVFENVALDDGRLGMRRRRQWRAPEAPAIGEGPEQTYAYDDGFSRWRSVLSSGAELHGLAREFPEEERTHLRDEGVLAQIVVPVFVDDEWWGFLGFDDYRDERVWPIAEVEALKAAADTLGAAISRSRAEAQRVEAQAEKRELEARTSAVLASALEGIVTMDESGRIVDFNAAAERTFGYTKGEVAGRPLADVMIPPELRDRHRAALARYLETGESTILGQHLELEAIRSNGERFPIELTVTKLDMPKATLFTGFIRDLTERHQAEEQLRATEQRYRALVEAAPAVVYTMGLDESWPLLFVSPSAKTVLGEPPEWWTAGRSWRAHIHPDDLAAVDRETARAMESGEPFAKEYRVVRPDGRTIWIFDNAVLITDEAGNPSAWQGLFVDLSSQKALEEVQRESELRYRSVVENVPVITYVEGPGGQGDLRFISPQVETILGYTPERRLADPDEWMSLVHPDDVAALTQVEEETQVTEEPFHAEYRVRAADGRWVWLRDDAVPIPDESGRLVFWQGIQQDITERRQAEEALREAEERYRAIVEHVPAAIYIDVPDGSMDSLYVSPHIEQIMGLTPEEYIADPNVWLDLMPDEAQRAQMRDSYVAAVEQRRPWKGEYLIRRPDGREVWVHDETTFVLNDEGQPLFLQGVMYDITERMLADQALQESERREREAAERLRALDEMKNTFLAAVSHELRSPLTSILGLALTLENQRLPQAEQEDLLGRVAANARKLERLLKDLLDVDRLSRGIVTPKVRPTDLAAVIERTVEHLDVVGDRPILIRTEPLVVPAEPAKIERIVENLVVNAVRHTGHDTDIWVRLWPQDGGAVIAVEDDGPGVPLELREAIFDPFRQGPTASPHSPGAGIGLSLVSMFAELHGGRAWVEEREGGGASFRVFLPGASAAEPVDGARLEQEPTGVGSEGAG